MADEYQLVPEPPRSGLRPAFGVWIEKGYPSHNRFETPGDCTICGTEKNLCTGEHEDYGPEQEPIPDEPTPAERYWEHVEAAAAAGDAADTPSGDDGGFSLR